jgi:hypothetical protein
VFNCSSYTFKLSYFVRVVKCSHKPLKNKREKMKQKPNLGFSVSKFLPVIHHSCRYPTPRVPHGYHTWGIAGVFCFPQSPTTSTSFILRLCNRWYSFIHHSLSLLPHHPSYAKDASKRRILSYSTGEDRTSLGTIPMVYRASARRDTHESIPVYTLSCLPIVRPWSIPNSS